VSVPGESTYLRKNRQYLEKFLKSVSRFTDTSAGNPMDTTTSDDILNRLHRYDTAVQETRDHAPERSNFGRYRAGAPYFEQYPLREVLAPFLGDAALTGALAEYDRITRDLRSLERLGGRAYREELCRDLSAYVEAYRTLLCYHELGMCNDRGSADLSIRDEIAILLLELRRDFPLADIEREVALLDDALRTIREAGYSVPPVENHPDGAAGASDPLWQQYFPARRPKEQIGFR
jgi:hypothetical protein